MNNVFRLLAAFLLFGPVTFCQSSQGADERVCNQRQEFR